MKVKSHAKTAVPDEFLIKIRSISEDLIRVTENCDLTEHQLIANLHRQTRELARVYQQLCHLQSEEEGKR